MTAQPPEIQLPQGPIPYREPAGASRSSSSTACWSTAASGTASSSASRGDFRCIVPDWPIGSHRIAMNPDADLSPPGSRR